MYQENVIMQHFFSFCFRKRDVICIRNTARNIKRDKNNGYKKIVRLIMTMKEKLSRLERLTNQYRLMETCVYIYMCYSIISPDVSHSREPISADFASLCSIYTYSITHFVSPRNFRVALRICNNIHT